MRTRTKRTRGTENPDAFLGLNMQIVRVAHLSFITHVERQLCIVNQGYREETGSQGTRQSTRNNEGSNGSYKRGAYRGNRNNTNSLQGNIAELGNNVYQYGTRDQGDRFTRTTEAIADYVGKEYCKEMRLLVKNQKENEPKEPVMPDKKEEAISPFVMKK
jgi:hypothetical protein